MNVWKGGWEEELAKITGANLHAIMSTCWYLNYISYGADWTKASSFSFLFFMFRIIIYCFLCLCSIMPVTLKHSMVRIMVYYARTLSKLVLWPLIHFLWQQ